MQREILTVSEINSYIKRILGQDTRLSSVLVRGEISNFTRHSSGHLYFSLKDETSKINAIIETGIKKVSIFLPLILIVGQKRMHKNIPIIPIKHKIAP